MLGIADYPAFVIAVLVFLAIPGPGNLALISATAQGGVRGGMAYGATDEFGFKAEDNPIHVHDLHATLLHLMGFDHEKLTFRHAGRDFRLTDVHGHVVHDIIA